MSEVKMGVDPSLAVVSARRTLRRLELEAYASVMTAFRAQGPLTRDKKCSLEQLGKLLGISSERHRAEARRAVNDELLSAIASCVCPADSEEMWQREGQKLASTNPRFVARQLSHLPHLLTSAAVSGALNLQNPRTDPELKKNTSAQVQNVLKFIISQNPLNGGGVGGGGGGNTKGKLTLPLPSIGKPLVKSPSKLTPAKEVSSITSSTSNVAQSVPVTTSTSSSNTPSPAKSPGKTTLKEEKISETTPVPSSPAKTMTTPNLEKPEKPPPPTAAEVVSTIEKPSKSALGGKSSMLLGLLEGGKKGPSGESTSSDNVPTPAAATERGPQTELKKDVEMKEMEEEKEEVEREEVKNVEEKAVEQETDKMEVEEKKEEEEESTIESDKSKNEKEDDMKNEDDTTNLKENDVAEKENFQTKQVEKEVDEKEEVQSAPMDESKEKSIQTESKATKLVCEEVLPEVVQNRRDLVPSEVKSTESETLLPETENISLPAPDHSYLEEKMIEKNEEEEEEEDEKEKEKEEDEKEEEEEEASLLSPAKPNKPENSESEEKMMEEEREDKNIVEEKVSESVKINDGSETVLQVSRKRPLPSDMGILPPSPKKALIDIQPTKDAISPTPTPPPPLPPLPPCSSPTRVSPPPPAPPLSPPPSLPPPPPPPSLPPSLSPPLPPSIHPPPPPPPPSSTIPIPIEQTFTKVTSFRTSPPSPSPPLPPKPSVPPLPPLINPPPSTEKPPARSREEERPRVVIRQIGPGVPFGRVGGVTIQPLLPASIPLPSVGGVTFTTASGYTTSVKSSSQAQVSLAICSRATSTSPPPPPLISLTGINPTPLTSIPLSLPTLSSANSTKATPPAPPTSLLLIKSSTTSNQKPPNLNTSSVALSSTCTTQQGQPSISDDVMMMSSTSDEALIKELCSEAVEEDATAADLASQLGLEYLEPNLLGGLDFMQLVNSPLEEVKPGNESPLLPGLSSSINPPMATPTAGDVPDTSQLLSEALTSLSNPSTPLLQSSLPAFHSPHFAPSPLVSLQSPIQLSSSSQMSPIFAAAASSPSLPHTHQSSLATQTPPTFTAHTPSLSSPLTPEILPDIQNLASVNEADLLEGIPPELAETIQALAQLSPIQ